MSHSFLRNGVIYCLTHIMSRGVSFVMLPLYARILSPADYARIDLLVLLGVVVNYTIVLEITQGIGRYLPDAETREQRRMLVSTALWFTLGVYTCFLLTVHVFADALAPRVLDPAATGATIRVAALSIAASALFFFSSQVLRWEQATGRFSVASVANGLVSLAVTAVLLLAFDLKVTGVLYGLAAGSLVGAILAVYFARDSYSLLFNRDMCLAMLRFSAPLVPADLSVFVASYIDRLAIKELMQIEDVGLYGMGYRIAALVSFAIIGFQSALPPLVMSSYREPGTPLEIARILRYFLLVTLSLLIALSLFAPEILFVFATPEYYSSADVVPLLVCAVTLAPMYIFAPGLRIAKKSGWLGGTIAVAAAVNTGLNFLLIPHLGIVGAALATTSSGLLALIVLMTLSQRLYPVPYAWGRIIGATAWAVGLVAAARLLMAGSSVSLALLGLKLGILGVAAGGLFALLVDGRDVRSVARGLRAFPAAAGNARAR